MKTITRLVLAFVVFVGSASSISAQATTGGVPSSSVPRAVPKDVDLTLYPILPERLMTAQDMAAMRLHPVVVMTPTVVRNYSHKTRAFFYDRLSVGELVAANDKGEWIYIIRCSNRIAIEKVCAVCLPVGAAATTNVTGNATPSTQTSKLGRGYQFPEWLRWLGRMVGNLIAFAMLLAILALVLLGAQLLGRWIINQFRRQGQAPGQPQPVVAPPVPAVVRRNGDRRQRDRRQGPRRQQARRAQFE